MIPPLFFFFSFVLHILTTKPLVYLPFFLHVVLQEVPKSQKYFSLPAGKSLDSKFSLRRRNDAGKPSKLPF